MSTMYVRLELSLFHHENKSSHRKNILEIRVRQLLLFEIEFQLTVFDELARYILSVGKILSTSPSFFYLVRTDVN